MSRKGADYWVLELAVKLKWRKFKADTKRRIQILNYVNLLRKIRRHHISQCRQVTKAGIEPKNSSYYFGIPLYIIYSPMGWQFYLDWSRLQTKAVLKGLTSSINAISSAAAVTRPPRQPETCQSELRLFKGNGSSFEQVAPRSSDSVNQNEIETLLTMTGRALDAKRQKMESMQKEMEELIDELEAKNEEILRLHMKISEREKDLRMKQEEKRAKEQELENERHLRVMAEGGIEALGLALERMRMDLVQEKSVQRTHNNLMLRRTSSEWQALEALEEERNARRAAEAALQVLERWMLESLTRMSVQKKHSSDDRDGLLLLADDSCYEDEDAPLNIPAMLGRITIEAQMQGIRLPL